MIWKTPKWCTYMVQELKSKIAIIGAGPAGCMCAYELQNDYEVYLFDCSAPLKTLLPTGGGRCNLAYNENDFMELAKNYPRGEKFLYSVFSKFSTADTIEFFENIGVKTYVQDDMRIFPVSNSSEFVREKFLKALNKVSFINEKVKDIKRVNYLFKVFTAHKTYNFDKIVIATGGHGSYDFIKNLGHDIVEPKKSLTGLKTSQNFSELSGVSLKNIYVRCGKYKLCGDMIFTHEGISGPVIYKISSLMAREKMPYKLITECTPNIDLQPALNSYPHKAVKNIISEFVPKSFAVYILKKLNINLETEAHKIDGQKRDGILKMLNEFEIIAVSPASGREVVTCGGVSLKQINSKTMESVICRGIYFCGEVLDIDGFCGGFNLQNCWSTGFAAAQGIKFCR